MLVKGKTQRKTSESSKADCNYDTPTHRKERIGLIRKGGNKMDKMRSLLLIWVGTFLLSACATVSYVDIQTFNPAEVTFPEYVRKVLIVNNAAPQPSDEGYTYTLYGVKQDTCRAKVDSALFEASRSLGETILEGAYFNDVLLYNQPLRIDSFYLSDPKLTPAQVTALCDANGADAIISWDRLLFEMKKEVDRLGEGLILGTVDVRMGGVLRSYLPGKEGPLATVVVGDSISWTESANGENMLDELLPTAEEALSMAGQYIGTKATPNFVPHWINETRWYFSGMGSQWKEAAAYAATDKWDKANARWKQVYDRSKGKNKARAASNLALSEEMSGHLDKAREWAQRSYELFKQYAGEKDDVTQLLKLYHEALTERIQKDLKLNVQFGEESY